jgi:hypothetical protein
MPKKLLVVWVTTAIVANLVVVVVWLFVASPSNYAWSPAAPEALRRIRTACDSIFWVGLLMWLVPVNLALVALLSLARAKALAAALGLLTILAAVLGHVWGTRTMAPHYLTLFETQAVAEAFLADPIIRAGAAIGPLVVPKINDREYPRRRYAISALGSLRYAPAIPALEHILTNKGDDYFVRGDAYQALVAIGTPGARAVIDRFWLHADPQLDSQLLEYLKIVGVSRPQHGPTTQGAGR